MSWQFYYGDTEAGNIQDITLDDGPPGYVRLTVSQWNTLEPQEAVVIIVDIPTHDFWQDLNGIRSHMIEH